MREQLNYAVKSFGDASVFPIVGLVVSVLEYSLGPISSVCCP